jgi:sulfur-carrier protein adenylyltransferase/sulfurtransferase
MKSELLNSRELRIFKQQMELPSVGLQGQEKFKKSKVLVVGAGGRGTFALQDLAAAGIGSIGICDDRMVEETTLPRQSLYGHGDLGKQKAIVSKQKILENNHVTQVGVHNIFLSDSNIIPIISNYDLIADATDSYEAHVIIDKAAQEAKIPVVFCELQNAVIFISVFHLGGEYSYRMLSDAILHGDHNTPISAPIPAEVIQYSLAGSLIANEVCKIVLGIPGILQGRLLTFDVTTFRMSINNLQNPSNFS